MDMMRYNEMRRDGNDLEKVQYLHIYNMVATGRKTMLSLHSTRK